MDDQHFSDNNFGLFIAYVLPGITATHGIPLLGMAGGSWQSIWTIPNQGFTELAIILLQAMTVGLIVSTIRWLTIDTIHHATGLRPPVWNSDSVGHGVAVLEFLIQIHYRYYKFYANMVVALCWSFLLSGWAFSWKVDCLYAALAVLFFVASRDSLQKYYSRTASLFGKA